MSEASDDGFDAWIEWEETRFILLGLCEKDGGDCHWEPNEDGLMECKTCGMTTDL